MKRGSYIHLTIGNCIYIKASLCHNISLVLFYVSLIIFGCVVPLCSIIRFYHCCGVIVGSLVLALLLYLWWKLYRNHKAIMFRHGAQ